MPSNPTQVCNLLVAASTVGPGTAAVGAPSQRTFNADLVSSDGAAAATVNIEASNTGIGWVVIGTINLAAATPGDGFYYEAPWGMVRANLVSIAGAGSRVTCAMGS